MYSCLNSPDNVNVTAVISVAVTVPTFVAPSSTTKVDDDVKYTGSCINYVYSSVAVPTLPEASVEV